MVGYLLASNWRHLRFGLNGESLKYIYLKFAFFSYIWASIIRKYDYRQPVNWWDKTSYLRLTLIRDIYKMDYGLKCKIGGTVFCSLILFKNVWYVIERLGQGQV